MNRLTLFTGTLVCGLLAACLAGCGGKSESKTTKTTPKKTVKDTAKKGHVHGPHNGHVAELTGGEKEYRAEITFDSKTRNISIYFLNHDDNEPADLKADEVELHLHEQEEQEMEDKGDHWVLAGDKVPTEIDNLEKIEGHIHVHAGTAVLEAEFGEHEEGDDHEHKKTEKKTEVKTEKKTS